MSITATSFQPSPFESRIRRLGRRISFWWHGETTAADVRNAFSAAAKAHEKYASNADSTFWLMREWSGQLGSPSFAPELGNPQLQDFMLEICGAVKPDATLMRQHNELLASVAHTFESLAADESHCKKYAHELMTARKNADKCRSNSEDPGLLEKSCEHWEERLNESVRIFRAKSNTHLRADIALLLSHMQAVEPTLHNTTERIDRAFRGINKDSMLRGSAPAGRRHEPALSTPFDIKSEGGSTPSSLLYDMSYEQNIEMHQPDQTSTYSNNSLGMPTDEQNKWRDDTNE